MANHPCGRRRPSGIPVPVVPPVTAGSPASAISAAPAACPEPEVRRWPHPTHCTPEPEVPDLPAALHYIHCSLSYQNQLLSEIRTLLECLSPDCRTEQEGK